MENHYNRYTVKLIQEVLSLQEGTEDLIVKNLKASEDFDEYTAKPENRGEKFSKSEIESLGNLDTKPYKISVDEIRFSSTEITNNKNKELMVVKKQGRYILFFCVRDPVDVSVTQNLDDKDKEEDKPDEIIIKVSQPFKDSKPEDPALLYNVINLVLNEYQI